MLSTGPWYTFWMSNDIAGKYTCTARVPGFSEVTADAHVMLKGMPSFIISNGDDPLILTEIGPIVS